MDKKEFHWLFMVSCGVGFWQNLGLGGKSVLDPAAVSTISLATSSHRDTKNGNQPLLFFHMNPTNSIVWTRKSHPFKWESTGNGLVPVLSVDPHKDAPVIT
jgi:hypothetical protein